MYIRRLSVLISSSVFAFMSHLAFAQKVAQVTCPTADEIKQFSYLASYPYGFNHESKNLKSIGVAVNMSDVDSDADSGWALVMHPLEVGQSESAVDVVQNTLEKLIPVSSTPFNYTVIDDLDIPVCAYTLPGNQEVNALAYFVDQSYDDMDDENFAKGRSKMSHQRIRMLKIVKQIKQFIRQ